MSRLCGSVASSGADDLLEPPSPVDPGGPVAGVTGRRQIRLRTSNIRQPPGEDQFPSNKSISRLP